MAILFTTENTSLPKIQKRKIKHWIKDVAKNYNKDLGDINYIFCDDKKILEINNKYLQHNYYTDIITFDYSYNNTISGDIFVSIDTVLSNSEKYNTSKEEELSRVIIHGILHLCGLKDKEEDDKKNMRLAEEKALKELTLI